ncbi:MAG: UDP-N-acetylmuramate--L-alanine ligase [Candidatus Firestonebacteria bacterium]
MLKKTYKVHFVGIGGIGMSGIAEVLLNLGYKVSGSDLKSGDTVERLKTLGAKIALGHKADNVRDVDVVVISSAVLPDNPEVVAAKQKGIPVIPRAEILAELMRLKKGIAIGGTHGKTTTTSMAAILMSEAGLDPTVVIGGKLNVIGSNAKLGRGEYLVAEADESDGSFLHLSPTVNIVTNIDDDHLDYHGNMENLKSVFINFMNKVPFYGFSVVCADDANIRSILPAVTKKYMTYGIKEKADLTASGIKFRNFGGSYTLTYLGKRMGKIELNVPGLHNVLNSMAVAGTGLGLGLSFSKIRSALKKFTGVQRRFEKIGEAQGILVVDDYGHHPTEISSTLKAAKNLKMKRTIAVFQPHRYSRSKLLYPKFCTAFFDAALIVVTDIYPAGEKPLANVSAELIANGIKANGKQVVFIKNKEEIPAYLKKTARSGDLVITLGAGDIRKYGEIFYREIAGK